MDAPNEQPAQPERSDKDTESARAQPTPKLGAAAPSGGGAAGRHRRHQGAWRERTGWPPGPPTDDHLHEKYPTLMNMLAEQSADGRNVREELVNLMSPAARRYARDRIPIVDAVDGLVHPDRFYRNLLSSQPLAFSVAGELRANPSAAAAVIAELTGLPTDGLTELAAPDVLVPAEHCQPRRLRDGRVKPYAPLDKYTPRWAHTGDKSGFDIAVCLTIKTPQNEPGPPGRRLLLSVEVKYTDSFSKDKVSWIKYRPHLEALGLTEKTTRELVEGGCSQVLRQVMITNSVVDTGLVPGASGLGRVDVGMAVVLARHDDRSAREVVKLLHERVSQPVQFWSHRDFLRACGRRSELSVWAEQMLERYVP
jgi:hypothetical protein